MPASLTCPPLDLAAVFARNRAIYGDAVMVASTTTTRDRRYSSWDDDELTAERDRLLDILDGEAVSDDDLEAADAMTGEVNARSATTNRRDELAGMAGVGRAGSPGALGQMLTAYRRAGMVGRMSKDLSVRSVVTLPDNPPSTLRPGIVAQPILPTTLLDLLSVEPTSVGSIEYLVDNSDDTNGALIVPEGMGKPEQQFDFETKDAKAETIAVWAAITRQALEDIPSMQTHLRTRLSAKVRARMESLAYAALTTATGVDESAGTTPNLITAAVAVNAALTVKGFAPQGVLVNPLDIAAQVVATTANGAWLGLPSGFTLPPLIGSAAIPRGTVLAFDRTAAMVLVRNDIRILVADQHADLFLKNVLVVLAETRAATVPLLPSGIAIGHIEPATP